MPRGVLVHGKVIDQATGLALPNATIHTVPTDASASNASPFIITTNQDGRFQFATLPGQGHLLIFGPSADYILEEIGFGKLYNSTPGGIRNHAHRIIPYEIKPGEPRAQIIADLRPAATVTAQVEGPSGEPVPTASLITRLDFHPQITHWIPNQPKIRNGQFELHGIDPKASARVHILDADHQWGTTVDISGRPSPDKLTIRLEHCGQATARFVGPNGKPRPNLEIWQNLSLVVTPGPPKNSNTKQDRAHLAAEEVYLFNLDPKHHKRGLRTDHYGSAHLTTLIPGATYRIIDTSTASNLQKGIQIRKEFQPKPGQTVNLGDILIEEPPQ